MSDEREVTVLSKSGAVTAVASRDLQENVIEQGEKESEVDFKARKRVLKKARLVRVLERGRVADRLHVDLPSDVHGEWILNEQMAITTARLKGFEIDDKYAVKRGLHTDGTGKPIVGDVIFMTMPMEDKELLDEVARDMYNQRHGDPRKRGLRDEAVKAENRAATELMREDGMPVIDESSTVAVGAPEIEAARQEASRST